MMTFYNVLKPGLLALSIALVSLAQAAETTMSELIIQDVTLISPERSQPLLHASVRIRDGQIVELRSGRFSEPGKAKIVDGRDRYLIPGLMDSHLHTTVIPGLGFSGYGYAKAHPELATAYEQQLPRSLLYFGITQLLDPAAIPASLKRLRSTELRPDIFHCGAAPIINGYPLMLLGAEPSLADFPYFIAESKDSLPDNIDPAQHTPEAVVQRMHADGAICVKLFLEDGWDLKSDWPLPSLDTIKRVRHEAHRLGMKVLAHANALDMQQLAVIEGVDVIAHGLWNWNKHRGETGLPVAIQQHLDQVRQQKIAFQPTLRVMDGIQALFMPETLRSQVLPKIVPAPLLAWYSTEEGPWFKQELIAEDFAGLPDSRIETMMHGPISQGERALRYLSEQNYPLLLASDFPANPGYGNQPGLSTYQELDHMAKIGMPLRAIFEAATINNAKTFDLDERYGSIEVGKVANLLLLKGNPLAAVEAYQQIDQVILHGRVIDRESLAADYTAAD